jgi:molybdenum cofactor biosynthesis enzyme MoaA
MKKQQYTFQNLYIITTYECNCNCDFCLFKYNKSECNENKILEKLQYIFQQTKIKNSLYIKITGGEPFLKPKLLKKIIALSDNEKVYKIGIGTNGTIVIPKFINDTKKRIEIFFSRHHYNDNINKKNFNINKNISITNITKNIKSSLIRLHFNCNLIKNDIDSIHKILNFIDYGIENKISSITFRELNDLETDDSMNYDKFVYDYQTYYKNNLIKISNIKKIFLKLNEFSYSRHNGNFYDTNHWFYYNKNNNQISIKLRQISEKRLIEYNKKNSGLDEWTIFPNGSLSLCWDKSKTIKEVIDEI